MQVPEIVMLEPLSEKGNKPVVPDGFMGRQIFFEKFSKHRGGMKYIQRQEPGNSDKSSGSPSNRVP
jgi:hypothetical protein